MSIRLSKKYGVNAAVPKCYFCYEDKNMVILVGKMRGDAEAPQGAIWDVEPCDKCHELMTQGVILISIRDDQEAELVAANREQRLPNPYRTGGFWVLTDDAIGRIFHPQDVVDSVLLRRFAFIPDEITAALGLRDAETQEDTCNL